MPTRSERGYLVRPTGGALIAFVPHPDVAGWWFRTRPAVIVAACPDCKSPAGTPCRGEEGYLSDTHVTRRATAEDKIKRFEASVAIVLDVQLKLRRRASR